MQTTRPVRAATLAVTLALGLALAAPPAVADPPPWAPAYGYRAKHGHGGHKKHKRYRERERTRTQAVYTLPAGLQGGACNPRLFDSGTVGALIGAAAGGYTGSRFGKGNGKLATTAIGTLVGAVVGHSVGERLSSPEDTCFGQTFEHVPDRQTITWRDSQRDARYQVSPTKTFKTAEGRYCREYTATATVGGKPVTTHGTACRQPDGRWQLVD